MNLQPIKRFTLRALLSANGTAMPEAALIDAISINCGKAPISDIATALRQLETSGLVSQNADDLIGITWTLTNLGEHKAKQIA